MTFNWTLVCYGKSSATAFRGNPRDETKYKNPDNDSRGAWMSRSILGLATKDQRPNLHFDITDPETGFSYSPPETTGWRYNRERMLQLIDEKAILFPASQSGRPREKKFRKDIQENFMSFPTVIDNIHTANGTEEVRALFGGQIFGFPKPTNILKMFIEQVVPQPDDIILDFFAGSSTTAHAVMQLNAEDGGKRRFIMVQLPEACDEKSEAYKAGYKTIAEIGKERIRRAGRKIKEELGIRNDEKKEEGQPEIFDGAPQNSSRTPHASSLDIGFRVLKVDTSNARDIYYTPDQIKQDELALHVDHIKEDRSGEDLLFQVMLDWGVDLSLPVSPESIQGKQVYFVDQNAIAACFETGINEAFVKELAKRQPLRAVFRDSGFANDAVKINIGEIFKLLSPTTELKTL